MDWMWDISTLGPAMVRVCIFNRCGRSLAIHAIHVSGVVCRGVLAISDAISHIEFSCRWGQSIFLGVCGIVSQYTQYSPPCLHSSTKRVGLYMLCLAQYPASSHLQSVFIVLRLKQIQRIVEWRYIHWLDNRISCVHLWEVFHHNYQKSYLLSNRETSVVMDYMLK